MSVSRLLTAAALVFATVVVTGCDGMLLYRVQRTPEADCIINPNGEFCGEVGPASTETWAVERRSDATVVYFGEEAWVATGVDGARQVLKEERATRDPGPCTSTLRRLLEFDEDGVELRATLEISSRIEGPPACGETPRGDRLLFNITGEFTREL
jgi:hypothetical protein